MIAVMYSAFRKRKPDEKAEEKQLNNQLHTKIRQRIVQLRSLGMNIKNPQIRQQTEEICKAAEKLLRTAGEDTDKVLQADRFTDNYLLTLGSVLTKYARLETNNSLTDEVTANAAECLQTIKTAAENQQQRLVQNDIMDIAAEMEVLLAMCRQDGLLAEEGFSFDTENKGITLVL